MLHIRIIFHIIHGRLELSMQPRFTTD